jgi:hypothetical protein
MIAIANVLEAVEAEQATVDWTVSAAVDQVADRCVAYPRFKIDRANEYGLAGTAKCVE